MEGGKAAYISSEALSAPGASFFIHRNLIHHRYHAFTLDECHHEFLWDNRVSDPCIPNPRATKGAIMSHHISFVIWRILAAVHPGASPIHDCQWQANSVVEMSLADAASCAWSPRPVRGALQLTYCTRVMDAEFRSSRQESGIRIVLGQRTVWSSAEVGENTKVAAADP
jgi:hypothetical protein